MASPSGSSPLVLQLLVPHPIGIRDAWDFEEVYGALLEGFIRAEAASRRDLFDAVQLEPVIKKELLRFLIVVW